MNAVTSFRKSKGILAPDKTTILPANGRGQIILVDCNGTLFDTRFDKGLNTPLVEFLILSEKMGYRVYLHSADPAGNLNSWVPLSQMRHPRFRQFMENRDPEFDPIIPKHGPIPTRDAILTIDDEHNAGFKSDAPMQWSPSDPNIEKTKEYWFSVALRAKGIVRSETIITRINIGA